MTIELKSPFSSVKNSLVTLSYHSARSREYFVQKRDKTLI